MQPEACGAATSSASTQALLSGARGCSARCATGWRRQLGIDVIGGSVSRDDPSLRRRLLDRSGHGMPLHAELLHKRAGRWQRFAKPILRLSIAVRIASAMLRYAGLPSSWRLNICKRTPPSVLPGCPGHSHIREVDCPTTGCPARAINSPRHRRRMSGLRFDMRIASHQHQARRL